MRLKDSGEYATMNCGMLPGLQNEEQLHQFRLALLPCWRWVDD
jgi:hypothetical protein